MCMTEKRVKLCIACVGIAVCSVGAILVMSSDPAANHQMKLSDCDGRAAYEAHPRVMATVSQPLRYAGSQVGVISSVGHDERTPCDHQPFGGMPVLYSDCILVTAEGSIIGRAAVIDASHGVPPGCRG